MVSEQIAREYLKDYARRANGVVEKYFAEKIAAAKEISRSSGETLGISEGMMEKYRDFMAGGKKLRGALVYLGYELVNGAADRAVLEASVAVEVIHSAILMHDDFMDGDNLRRGLPTVHKFYERFHGEKFLAGEAKHYGDSMAVDLGDAGMFMCVEILAAAPLPEGRKSKAMVELSRLLLQTAFGQGMDVTYELCRQVTKEDVMRIHNYKTAYYTVAGPLRIGAILAGANEKTLAAMSEFGKPVGVAFQLRDDELGLFSDEKTLGKPIGSDIREGKMTVLRIKAQELAEGEERRFLKEAYGNKQLTGDEVRRVQEITRKVGALEYSRNLSRKLVEQGKRAIPKITSEKKEQELLASLAELMITREL